jgi:uncharacterized repeat protein (TIGR01451 family)
VDVNPSNDELTACFTILNSYDPNLKSASPVATVDTGAQWLNYTVQFQNTGTDTAYTVVVKDTLSAYVDAMSLQYLDASHRAVVQLFHNVLVITFPRINLVDSQHNEPLSHGWLQYKVRAKSKLPIGTQIKNRASIYFDLNSPVVTNTTVNIVQLDTSPKPTAIHEVSSSPTLRLYPNPNNGSFTLETSSILNKEYHIYDMLGQVIQQGIVHTSREQIDMDSNLSGIYILAIRSTGEVARFTVTR